MTQFDLRSASLDALLARNRQLRVRFAEGSPQRLQLGRLQAWQAGRLEQTYRDLKDRERYRAGVEFFLDELYGESDFLPRDVQLQRAYPIMQRMLPAPAMETLRMAVQLEVLSQELDGDMVLSLGSIGLIDARSYGEAYRKTGRPADRAWQIRLLVEAGRDLDRLVRYPLIYGLIRMAHRPAHLAGFGTLHDFLENGFRAFRAMGGAGDFLAAVELRETRIMERLFSAQEDPFRLDGH